jgi:MerR family transcriptional regulator/heat shock protein HspR
MSEQISRSRLVRLEVAAEAVRLPPARVRRYERAGLVRPASGQGAEALFGEDELARLRKIRRLREDLGLNQAGIEVVLRLLHEIETLRTALGRDEGQATHSRP